MYLCTNICVDIDVCVSVHIDLDVCVGVEKGIHLNVNLNVDVDVDRCSRGFGHWHKDARSCCFSE